MMKVYLIGYDLRKTGQDYETLTTKIQGLGSWWHCLDSTWLVKSNKTAIEIRDYLRQFVDSNDVLLVAQISSGIWASYGFQGDCAEWLKNNL